MGFFTLIVVVCCLYSCSLVFIVKINLKTCRCEQQCCLYAVGKTQNTWNFEEQLQARRGRGEEEGAQEHGTLECLELDGTDGQRSVIWNMFYDNKEYWRVCVGLSLSNVWPPIQAATLITWLAWRPCGAVYWHSSYRQSDLWSEIVCMKI